MAPGDRDIVVWSRPLALCPRAGQRHERGGPCPQLALEPLRLEIAPELIQLWSLLDWKKLLSSFSTFVAAPREVCRKREVVLPRIFQQCVGWLPSPSSGAARKVPVGRADGGEQREVVPSTHPARGE